jgi:hypothetical protein
MLSMLTLSATDAAESVALTGASPAAEVSGAGVLPALPQASAPSAAAAIRLRRIITSSSPG